ncbi:hypothetical protein P4V88_26680 [Bacillus thuringiensis]|uniref:hypothetical protein n=1 Tax=Bacillus thuringiensis TaxID=1428 RepID=UPI001E50E0F0|nr:hypothetical protein [Bacillus thuringiensis]MED2129060.1 hypothetical protein [Bacillus thuringiensis]MED2148158.1 hypothetical protein [Bacillus thuringiensis]MED2175485.1 hypothetical protein [Bacillus thuringiensis]MED3507615.1 hypothetical protein [Bacillus thuringiensis]
MEQRFEVKPIGVKYICDSCEEGEMIYTGEMLFLILQHSNTLVTIVIVIKILLRNIL